MGTVAVAYRAYREALPVLVVSAGGGILAGTVLGGMDAELERVPGLLTLVPALLATRGNVYGSLGARLGSGLHQGLVEPRFDLEDPRLRAAIVAALANGVLISVLAAVMTFAVLQALPGPVAPLFVLVAIATVAGVLSGVALTVVVIAVVFYGFRRGIDPDALAGPVVTTTGDVVGIAALLIAVRLVVGGIP